mgnify:CR=1 FL=1
MAHSVMAKQMTQRRKNLPEQKKNINFVIK